MYFLSWVSSFAQGLSSLLSYSIPGRGAFSLACSLPKQAPLPVSLVSFILSMFSVMIHSLYVTEENGQKVPMTSNISRHRCLRNVFCACFFLLCVANHRPPPPPPPPVQSPVAGLWQVIPQDFHVYALGGFALLSLILIIMARFSSRYARSLLLQVHTSAPTAAALAVAAHLSLIQKIYIKKINK